MKKVNSFTDRWRWKGLLAAAPAMAVLLIFVFYPMALNIGYCFTDYNGYDASNVNFVGLVNFQRILTDGNFLQSVRNTFVLAAIYIVGLNVLAVTMAVLITKVSRGFGNAVKSVLYFPCLLAAVVSGFVWRLILDSRNGLLNVILRAIGLDSLAQGWLGNPSLVLPSVAVALIWAGLGYYTVIYYAGLMAIPVELYEASDVEGATSWQTFRHVTLPLLANSITINLVLTSMAILSTFDLPYTLTNGGGPGYYGSTISIMIYTTAYEKAQTGKAFAMATVLMVIAMLVALVELKFMLKKEERT